MHNKLISVLILLCLSAVSHASSLAIKLNVPPTGQTSVTRILKAGSLLTGAQATHLVKTPHLTVAYIDKLPNVKAGKALGMKATRFLNNYLKRNNILFSIDHAAVKFGRYTVLVPTVNSYVNLKKLNKDLEAFIKTQGYPLSSTTNNQHYTPHITLVNNTTGPSRLTSMNAEVRKLKAMKRASFKFTASSYSVK